MSDDERPGWLMTTVTILIVALLGLTVVVVSMILFASPARSEVGTVRGIASWYGPGTGVATQWCTWTLRHEKGCGIARITSLETGLTVEAPIVDWCQCYRGTLDERIIDLQWDVVTALGLSRSQGLYPVEVTWLTGPAQPPAPPVLPDAAMAPPAR